MATIPTPPLLNPDTRPLPRGWTQTYSAERKLWIYLDMNVLPPRVSLTHPSGPLPATPSRRPVTHGRAVPTGFSDWPSTNTPHRNAIQAHRDRQNMTVAQRLYSSALPPTQEEKAGFDEFGIPVNFGTDELAAPSYGESINTIPFTSSASPVSAASTTTSSSSSPVPQYIGRTPARRPLPKPPISNSTTTTPSQRPTPSRPPDNSTLTIAVDHPLPPAPLQPTPIKANDGVLSRQQVDSADLANALLQAIPQTEHGKPSGFAVHTKKAEPSGYKPSSNNVPHRPVLPPRSPSHTLPKKPSFVSQSSSSVSTNTPLNSPHIPSPSRAEAQFQLPSIPSGRASMSNLPNSAASLAQSATSLLSPAAPPLTRGTSAPPTPEPLKVQFQPNLKPPRNTFAPPEIVAMFNRRMVSSNSTGSDKDAFDPMSLYSDPSHSPSQRALSASPQSNEHKSLNAASQTLSHSTSARTSMSSCVSPNPSAISISGAATGQAPMQHATNKDPDLVETSKSNQDNPSKKDGRNKLKKLSLGFGRMSFLPKKTNIAHQLDLTADSLLDSSRPPRISAEQVGKVIKDGFIAVMGENTHRGDIQLPEPAGTSSLHVRMQAANMGSRTSLFQPQDTNGPLRSSTPQPNVLSPLPFPLNQSLSKATLRPNQPPEAFGSQAAPQIQSYGLNENAGMLSQSRRQSSSSPSLAPRLSPMLPSPKRASFQGPSQPALAQPQPQRRFGRNDPFDTPLQIPTSPAPEYRPSTTMGSLYNNSPSQYQPSGYADLGESPLE